MTPLSFPPCQIITTWGPSTDSIFECVWSWTRQVLVLQKLATWGGVQSSKSYQMVSLPTPHFQCFLGLFFLLVFYPGVCFPGNLCVQITELKWITCRNNLRLSPERTSNCFWSPREDTASQGLHLNIDPVWHSPNHSRVQVWIRAVVPSDPSSGSGVLLGSGFRLVLTGGMLAE